MRKRTFLLRYLFFCSRLFCPRSSRAAATAMGRFLAHAAVALRCLAVRAVDQPIGAKRPVRVLREAHAHEKFPVLLTRHHCHKALAGLGIPLAAGHCPAADGADAFLPCHCRKRLSFIGVAVAHVAGDTARKLRAVKAVLVLLRRLLIGVDALCEAKSAADRAPCGRRLRARRGQVLSARCP